MYLLSLNCYEREVSEIWLGTAGGSPQRNGCYSSLLPVRQVFLGLLPTATVELINTLVGIATSVSHHCSQTDSGWPSSGLGNSRCRAREIVPVLIWQHLPSSKFCAAMSLPHLSPPVPSIVHSRTSTNMGAGVASQTGGTSFLEQSQFPYSHLWFVDSVRLLRWGYPAPPNHCFSCISQQLKYRLSPSILVTAPTQAIWLADT